MFSEKPHAFGPRAQEFAKAILGERMGCRPSADAGTATAAPNVALVKYWGKRDEELKLPLAGSLSISLPGLATTTRVAPAAPGNTATDRIFVGAADGTESLLPPEAPFAARLAAFLDLFRPTPDFLFEVHTRNNFPTAAGLASSASGFAALVLALDRLYQWNLAPKELSMLARLGSGSAARSIEDGFVEWLPGTRDDGLDSYAIRLALPWPGLGLATVLADASPKAVGSTEGMRRTAATSFAYPGWPHRVAEDLAAARAAIAAQDLAALGAVAEANCLAMHGLMWTAYPPLVYQCAATLQAMQTVWAARAQGLRIWFTMDAGPNLKLLFDSSEAAALRPLFGPALTFLPPEKAPELHGIGSP